MNLKPVHPTHGFSLSIFFSVKVKRIRQKSSNGIAQHGQQINRFWLIDNRVISVKISLISARHFRVPEYTPVATNPEFKDIDWHISHRQEPTYGTEIKPRQSVTQPSKDPRANPRL